MWTTRRKQTHTTMGSYGSKQDETYQYYFKHLNIFSSRVRVWWTMDLNKLILIFTVYWQMYVVDTYYSYRSWIAYTANIVHKLYGIQSLWKIVFSSHEYARHDIFRHGNLVIHLKFSLILHDAIPWQYGSLRIQLSLKHLYMYSYFYVFIYIAHFRFGNNSYTLFKNKIRSNQTIHHKVSSIAVHPSAHFLYIYI